MTDAIFVVGMNGSGTTMMLDHLNSHSQIYGFREETRILPHFIRTASRYGDLSKNENYRRLWDDMRKSFPFWHANGDTPVPLPDDWANDERRSPHRVFDRILSHFAAQEGKPVWAEKTPMHALHIADLAAGLPNTRFVHMIRDGRDCAASFSRRWRYDPQLTIQRWKQTIGTARDQATSLEDGRYMEVRFEELTVEPEAVLREVLRFLDLPYEAAVLSSKRTAGRMRGIESRVLRPNSGSHRSYFSDAQRAKLERIAGACLHELGYDSDNPSGNKDLNPLWIRISQLRTYAVRLKDVVRRARNSDRPWQLFIGRLRSGWSHIRSNKQ